jgi:hypothetical protein
MTVVELVAATLFAATVLLGGFGVLTRPAGPGAGPSDSTAHAKATPSAANDPRAAAASGTTSTPRAILSSPSDLPSPSATPVPPCSTETLSVVTGPAMPPTAAAPADLNGAAGQMVGAYITRPAEDGTIPSDIWAVRAGVATRVASMVGGRVNSMTVDAISPDGSTILVSIGEVYYTMPLPECSDLYLIRRLTRNAANVSDFGGSFSFDGRYVAFIHTEGKHFAPVVGLIDLDGDRQPKLSACAPTVSYIDVRWAPNDHRLAVWCGSVMQLVFVGGSAGSIDVPFADEQEDGMIWRDPASIVVVTGSADAPGIRVRTYSMPGTGLGSLDGAFSNPTDIAPALGDPGPALDVSPDRRVATFWSAPITTAGDEVEGRYALDFTTRKATLLPSMLGAVQQGWTADSRSIIAVSPFREVGPHPTLFAQPVTGGGRVILGSLPGHYWQGIWQLP